MAAFEPTGDLLTDLQSAIDNQVVVQLEYTDRKGDTSIRLAAPLEVRGDGLYIWSMGPEKFGLRLLKLDGIGQYEIKDDTFDREQFQ